MTTIDMSGTHLNLTQEQMIKQVLVELSNQGRRIADLTIDYETCLRPDDVRVHTGKRTITIVTEEPGGPIVPVQFCNWCLDPDNPSVRCHPDGGPAHRDPALMKKAGHP